MAEESIKALDQWTNDFGDDYTDRQDDKIFARAELFDLRIGIGDLPKDGVYDCLGFDVIDSVLEVGANTGQNLKALESIGFHPDELTGLEPNTAAAVELVKDGFNIIGKTASDIDCVDNSFDLVFTSGLLIHIPPSDLTTAMEEIVRVSRRYVLAIEYFSRTPTMIPYRGMDEMLWSRDFGLVYMEEFGLKHIDHGFAWKPATGLDDLNWWLLEK